MIIVKCIACNIALENFFPPPQSEKKIITWSGSDERKIALHSLDRNLRLALTIFFILYKKLNEYQEVAH